MNYTSPEYLGWLSTRGAWKAILSNPYKAGTSLAHRWQVARDEALGKSKSRLGAVELYDRQINPPQHFYDTDRRTA